MGRFADACIEDLSDAELADFECLMEAPDSEIFLWITGERETPATFDTVLLRRLRAFHLASPADR